MDWLGLNKEDNLLRKDIAEFAEKELGEDVLEFDKDYKQFDTAWKKVAQLGLFGILLAEKHGGAEMGPLSLAVCLEELAAVSPSFAMAVAGQNIAGYAIQKFSALPAKDDILAEIIQGTTVGLNFEDAGSLAFDENTNTITGEERFVLNGFNSKYFLTDNCAGLDAWALIYNDNSCSFQKEDEGIGMRSCGLGKFMLEDAKLDKNQVLQDDAGAIRELFRICAAAVATGVSQGAYEAAIPYSKERVQFGRPIAKFGMVRKMVSEIEENTRVSRLLVYDAAKKFGNGDKVAAHIASTVSRKNAMVSGDRAVQILGGAGYTKDYPAEMFFRDAKALEVLLRSPDEEQEIIGKIITA